jgi:hypothetical protein
LRDPGQQHSEEQKMFASVRRYEGIDPSSADEIMQLVDEGFSNIISQTPGFIAYYALDAGNGVIASISVFEDRAGAEESNRLDADWVGEYLAALIQTPPQTTAGNVLVFRAAEAFRQR